MAGQVKPIPEGFHTITPYLCVRNAGQAIEFYKKAFGAEEMYRMPGPDGKSIMHAELRIGDSPLMISEEMPQADHWGSPQQLNGTAVCLHLYVEDVDKSYQRAVDAGATATMPVMDAFWGDRFGKLTDPFGHERSIATHKQDVTPRKSPKARRSSLRIWVAGRGNRPRTDCPWAYRGYCACRQRSIRRPGLLYGSARPCLSLIAA